MGFDQVLLQSATKREQHVTRRVIDPQTGSFITVLEAEYAPTRLEPWQVWFVCPIEGTTHPRSEGVKVRGVWYSPKAAEDIIARRGRGDTSGVFIDTSEGVEWCNGKFAFRPRACGDTFYALTRADDRAMFTQDGTVMGVYLAE